MAVVSLGADIFTRHIGRVLGRDFSNEWIAGRLALQGSPWCAFDENCFRLAMYRQLDVLNLQNFSYPPHTLFLDTPFALAPYYLALALWTVFGCAVFYCAAKPALSAGFRPVWVLVTPAALLNIWNGHYGFVLGALWLLFFRNLRRRPVTSGVMAGLLTIKPHMGLLIALATVTRWRALLGAVVTTATLVLGSAAVFGPATWFDFFTATTAAQTDVLTRTTGDFYFRMMPSAYVAYGHGIAGLAAQVVFGANAMFLIARSRKVDAFTFATATFLIVPYVFNYDMTVTCLGIALLLWTRWVELSLFERAVLSLAFVSPELTYFAPWAVPPVLLAALYVQTSKLGGTHTKSVTAAQDDRDCLASFQERPSTVAR
ncbi:glycosyl transferase family 87 [Sphingomonas sp. F9_3S_D5_B_2]